MTKSGIERCVPLVGEALEVVAGLVGERASETSDCIVTGFGGEKLSGSYVGKRFR